MNLGELRQWFVKESGRYDLVVDSTSWLDNGANVYINAAQRMLDRMQESSKSIGRAFKQLESGRQFVAFDACRAILDVWAISSSGRSRLERKSNRELRETYSNLEEMENGSPLYYCPAVLRMAPETDRTMVGEVNAPLQYLDIMIDSHYAYNGVMVYPATDVEITIEVWALFYSTQMTSDDQESYWSVVHPELLVMASQCLLEKFNRNSEGVNDWMLAIQNELRGIDFDLVEEEVHDISQMRG